MRPTLEVQPLCSLCLALAVVSTYIRGAALAPGSNDDKRRQKIIFKMLSSSSNEGLAPKDQPDYKSYDIDINPALNNRAGDLTRRDDVVAIKGDDSGPPILGKDKTPLTLAMMERFKSTWCKTEPFTQLIKEKGCISRKVLNRFCYGQCNSFYIPKTLRRRTKRKVFKSCGFCRPKRTNTIIVTLKCPGRKKGFKQKKVRQVKECQCQER
ncbi:gremlin-2-like [Mya arenaria]|nr:gremlin-2-like [Mya arenaria]